MVKKHKVKLLFLQETKMKEITATTARDLWHGGRPTWETLEADGASGGIVMMWDQGTIEQLKVEKGRNYKNGKLSQYMGQPLMQQGGDFNAIRSPSEKKGGRRTITAAMTNFQSFISDHELIDLGLSGGAYTWTNGRKPPILAKLDRFLANQQWLDLFGASSNSVLTRIASDHNLILLETQPNSWGPSPFRFENCWLLEDEFIQGLQQWWEELEVNGTRGCQFSQKLKGLKGKIKIWCKERKLNFEKERTDILSMLDTFNQKEEQQDLDIFEEVERDKLRREAEKLDTQELIYWRQRAHYKWIKEGDLNSKLFHMIASHRRRINRINMLQIDGQTITKPEVIEETFVKFYKDLYEEEDQQRPFPENLKVTVLKEEAAQSLIEPFTEEEINTAIFSLSGDKALGPDGFTAEFYKAGWEFMKNDIMNLFQEFYDDGITSDSMGSSFITLIPKKEWAAHPKDFKPISLVSSHYKIISRVLASPLKRVLGQVISKHQSAFIQGRQILDSAIILHELVHQYSKKIERGAILKLDFQKAFDKVNWCFLDKIMEKMGFPQQWRRWISSCISSARFSLILNGTVKSYFKSSRGLRQGDPLSPLLFNIVSEGLCAMILEGQEKGWLLDLSIKNLHVPILQFADDTVLLCQGTNEQMLNAITVLNLYQIASGQNINWEKSSMLGLNIEDELEEHMRSIIGCPKMILPSTYLGLPLYQGRATKQIWNNVIERCQKRLETWKGKFLSHAGRVTLVKATLARIPTYYLSLMECPASVVKKLEAIQRTFLWCGSDNLFKYPLEKSALWRQVLDTKYGSTQNKWLPRKCSNSTMSSLWKGIMKRAPEVIRHIRFHVRTGTKVNFWTDAWIGQNPLSISFPAVFHLSLNKEVKVSSIMSNNILAGRDLQLRRDLKEEEVIQVAELVQLIDSQYMPSSGVDEIIWAPEPDGEYTVASYYKLSQPTASPSPSGTYHIWKLIAPAKKFKVNLCMPASFQFLIEQWSASPLPYWGKILWKATLAAIPCIHGLPPLPLPVLKKFWSSVVHFTAPKPPNMVQWKPPLPPLVKLNFDGSSIRNPGHAGVGGVIRDSAGEILMAYSGPAGVCGSNVAEAKALLTGIKLLKQLQITSVEIEGDSQLVIGWARKPGSAPWAMRSIFDEIHDTVRDWRIAWMATPRSANSLADQLAKVGVSANGLNTSQSLQQIL
ncbi:hypothetical protein H6P81_012880 [Aristolochia fimbriata]|uniref:Reverse transcriptase domain-containing protein n=1 Tax=Aristolochia fimbriata TaxID=158543 RepID=A0AAV7ED36_ARIFI|nr:hypothetical protein H6P81_012880 [Aristolochia fimbriata]